MAETSVQTPRELTVKIRHPELLERLIDKLAETSRDMQSINVNMTPVKSHAKERWQEVVDETATVLKKLIGK